jgi:hypothetical protein
MKDTVQMLQQQSLLHALTIFQYTEEHLRHAYLSNASQSAMYELVVKVLLP